MARALNEGLMKKIVKDLTKDFRAWGKPAAQRVRRGVNKWGVRFDVFCDGKVG